MGLGEKAGVEVERGAVEEWSVGGGQCEGGATIWVVGIAAKEVRTMTGTDRTILGEGGGRVSVALDEVVFVPLPEQERCGSSGGWLGGFGSGAAGRRRMSNRSR